MLSKLAVEEEKCLAEIHVVCIEYVALLFFPQTESSQIVTLILWHGFFVVHLVYLCQNCSEFPSGVSLPTVGVLSGCVVWEVAVAVTDCMEVSVGLVSVKDKSEL